MDNNEDPRLAPYFKLKIFDADNLFGYVSEDNKVVFIPGRRNGIDNKDVTYMYGMHSDGKSIDVSNILRCPGKMSACLTGEERISFAKIYTDLTLLGW